MLPPDGYLLPLSPLLQIDLLTKRILGPLRLLTRIWCDLHLVVIREPLTTFRF
jgi:hypothetical protein